MFPRTSCSCAALAWCQKDPVISKILSIAISPCVRCALYASSKAPGSRGQPRSAEHVPQSLLQLRCIGQTSWADRWPLMVEE